MVNKAYEDVFDEVTLLATSATGTLPVVELEDSTAFRMMDMGERKDCQHLLIRDANATDGTTMKGGLTKIVQDFEAAKERTPCTVPVIPGFGMVKGDVPCCME